MHGSAQRNHIEAYCDNGWVGWAKAHGVILKILRGGKLTAPVPFNLLKNPAIAPRERGVWTRRRVVLFGGRESLYESRLKRDTSSRRRTGSREANHSRLEMTTGHEQIRRGNLVNREWKRLFLRSQYGSNGKGRNQRAAVAQEGERKPVVREYGSPKQGAAGEGASKAQSARRWRRRPIARVWGRRAERQQSTGCGGGRRVWS